MVGGGGKIRGAGWKTFYERDRSYECISAVPGTDRRDPAREKKIRYKVWGGQGTVNTCHIWYYKCLFAGFFTIHYGLFHWGYYTFIVESGLFGTVHFSDPNIWFSCSLFFVNHLYSYLTYRHQESKGAIYIIEQFFRPYQRIIPMHLTIIFGSIVVFALQVFGIQSTMPVLVLFLVLKTYFDISTNLIKHEEEKIPYDPSPVYWIPRILSYKRR
ncbi:MAG: DUF6498-containing protein [Methanoregula sp.]